MRLATIASGSSGNCTYFGTDHTHVLVDAGISCKRITEALKTLDVAPEEISGILITHEHADHIAGLRVFCRKNHTPLYATPGTIRAILRQDKTGTLAQEMFTPIGADRPFALGDVSVTPFAISHDAAEPVGYRADACGHALAVVTDLGCFDGELLGRLSGLEAVVAEANHDVRMLEAGPYPFDLKRRILGRKGHLSNETAGELVSALLNERMRHVFLGHLSKENNYPELARETVCCAVDMADVAYKAKDFPITVAPRDGLSKIISW